MAALGRGVLLLVLGFLCRRGVGAFVLQAPASLGALARGSARSVPRAPARRQRRQA